MITGENGLHLIKTYEGLRLKAYKCPAGVLTIGYGHTSGVKPGDVITEEQAETMLKNDLKIYENYVNNYVNVPLTQNQFDALVSFTYNLGGGTLKESSLLKRLNEGKYDDASYWFDRYVYAGRKKLQGLVNRRAKEKELFLKK